MNDHDKVLQEAEQQICMANYDPKDPTKAKRLREKKESYRKYLDRRVMDQEERKMFSFEKK